MMKTLKHYPFAVIGFVVFLFFIFLALFAPFLSPYDPYEQHLLESLFPASGEHLLGQDLLGRDILSRLLYGSQVSLFVGIVTVFISAVIGVSLGGCAAVFGGFADDLLMRIIDIFLAFPGILLAIALMAVLGPGVSNVIFALCLTGWVSFARLTRAQVLSLRERGYILAARSIGVSRERLLFVHLLPNALSPLIVEASFMLASVIVAEAGLSFLGLGVQPPYPSWGAMLNEGRTFLMVSPSLTLYPGLCLLFLVLSVNMIGDALRDILDVRQLSCQ